MADLLLNTIALDPNRWTADKIPHYALADLLPAVAEAGFPDVEIWHYHLTHPSEAGVAALDERMQHLGLRAPVVGAYPVLHLEGEALYRERAAMHALMDRAHRLGARVVKCFAGRLGSDAVDEPAYARSVRFTRELAAYAGSLGLTLTAETHPDTLCDSVAACRRFLEAVEASNLHLCFQPFDFTDTAQAGADYEALRKHVIHVHLQGRANDRITLLEEADIDYRPVLQALADGGFDGYLCIEFVKGCVVDRPDAFDLDLVLANARRDRDFVLQVASEAGLLVTT